MRLSAIVFVLLCSGSWLTSCDGGDKHTSVAIDTPAKVAADKTNIPDAFDAEFADGMTEKVWQNYLQLRTALVGSDAGGARTAAGNLAESFTDERPQLRTLAQQLAATDELAEQRRLFSDFTAAVEPLFSEGLTSGTIYKQYCPMAFDNTGANWFSDAEPIRNPYFGDKMLTCGKTVATISQ